MYNEIHWFSIIIQHILNPINDDTGMVKLKLLPDTCYFLKLPVFAKFNGNGHCAYARHLTDNLESTLAFVS